MDVRGVAKWTNGGERHGHLYLKRPMDKSLPPTKAGEIKSGIKSDTVDKNDFFFDHLAFL